MRIRTRASLIESVTQELVNILNHETIVPAPGSAPPRNAVDLVFVKMAVIIGPYRNMPYTGFGWAIGDPGRIRTGDLEIRSFVLLFCHALR